MTLVTKYPALHNPPGPEVSEDDRLAWRRQAAEEMERIFIKFLTHGVVEVVAEEWSPLLQRNTIRVTIVAGVDEAEYRRLMLIEVGNA
jgi:hypothetical protein